MPSEFIKCQLDLSYANYFKKAIVQRTEFIHFESIHVLKIKMCQSEGQLDITVRTEKGAKRETLAVPTQAQSQAEGVSDFEVQQNHPRVWVTQTAEPTPRSS